MTAEDEKTILGDPRLGCRSDGEAVSAVGAKPEHFSFPHFTIRALHGGRDPKEDAHDAQSHAPLLSLVWRAQIEEGALQAA